MHQLPTGLRKKLTIPSLRFVAKVVFPLHAPALQRPLHFQAVGHSHTLLLYIAVLRCTAAPPPPHTHTCAPVSLPAAAPPVVQAVQTPATAQPQCPARSRTTGRSRGAPSRTTLQQLTHRHDVRGPGCAPKPFDTASVPCLPLSTGLFYGWMHFLWLYAHAHRHSIHAQQPWSILADLHTCCWVSSLASHALLETYFMV